MAENSPKLYFARCNLFEVTDLLLRKYDTNDEEKKLLQKIFWDKALNFHLNEITEDEETYIHGGWPLSWMAVRLMHTLQQGYNSNNVLELSESLASKRKEIYFTSLLQNLKDLTPENCKELQDIFSKALFSNLISKKNTLKKLSSFNEQSLLKSLVNNTGKTHFLLEQISCDHEAFVEVTKGIKNLYILGVKHCLQNLTYCDDLSGKKLLNTLFALLLVMPACNPSITEELGRGLYSLSERGVLDLTSLLMVAGCQGDRQLYSYLTGCLSRRMLRHVNCTNSTDIDLINNVFGVIVTDNNRLYLEELCLRSLSSKNHWLEELIGMGTQFVLAKDHAKLQILKCFPALWPALAVKLWKQLNNSPDVLDIVLPIVETCQELYPDLFGHLSEILKRLQLMTTWLRSEGAGGGESDVNTMLSLTASHSPLYVLLATTNFSTLDHDRLLQLLSQLEGPNSWNVTIFEGFRILFGAFQIYLRAVDIFNQYEKDEPMMCLKYKEEISKAVSELSQSLNRIEPLDFRIELLEDIFQLMFLRSEDYCEEAGGSERSEEEIDTARVQLARSVSEGATTVPRSLPSTLRRTSVSGHTATSSSYPSSSQRSRQSRRNSKVIPLQLSQGFVCYPLLANDILNCLKQSLEYSESNCDKNDCDRLLRLKESVEDAMWRLDMIWSPESSDYLSHNGADKGWVYNASEDDSSDSDSAFAGSASPIRRNKRLKKVESSNKSESGGHLTAGLKSRSSSVKCKRCSRLFSTSSNLINLMLTSPVSLVSYFIAKNDLERAEKGVQKFNLAGSSVDVELNFLKEFSQLRKRLCDIDAKPTDEVYLTRNASLQAISETTSSGVVFVALTKLIETFFTITPLPEEVADNKGVVVLDLALSHRGPLSHSACLLDLASNYFSTSSPSPVAANLVAFTSALRSVVQEAKGYISLEEILLDPSLPLNSGDHVKKICSFWTNLQECIHGFQRALKDGNNDLADAAYLKLTACAINGQGLVQNYQDETKQHFLNQLRNYLTCLWKVVSHRVEGGTKYHILHYSLDSLIGDLVFSEKKDPMAIEAALQSTSVNVVHSVVANCTPHLTIEQLKQLPSTFVLNTCCDTSQECIPCHPDQVSLFLSELLESIDVSSSAGLYELPSCPAVKRVLTSTNRLMMLDWAQLMPGDETFAFFVNLYNLMWLHALITLELTDKYGLLSPSACLRDLSTRSVGYLMPNNYFLTLAELRQALTALPACLINSTLPRKAPALPVNISSDPRMLFLLASPYKLSPVIQVLPSCELDQEVDARMSAYIEATVQISEKHVTVPMTLCHYVDYVTMTQGTESEVGSEEISNSGREHMIDFIKEFLKEDVLGKDVIIKKEIGLTITKSYLSNLQLEEDSKSTKEYVDDWKTKETRPDILKYLAARNPLLGQAVEKIHCIETAIESGRSPSLTNPLERHLQSREATSLATLYDHNVMLVTLKSLLDSDKLWAWFDTAVQQQDWLACLEMLTYVPEKQIKADPRFIEFYDWVLEQLSASQDGWVYCQRIEDPQKLCDLILANSDKWSAEGCITMFHTLLSMDTTGLPLSSITKAKQLQSDIQTTSKVSKACVLSPTGDAWAVLEELMKCGKVTLALQWCHHNQLINVEQTSQTLLLIGQLVLDLLERGQEISAQELLELLPSDQAVLISENIVSRAHSVSSLQHIVHFMRLQNTTPAQALRYEYLDIGVHMLTHIPWQEQEGYRNLVSQPELLVEQLLMSTRISTLETILEDLKDRICALPPSSPISPPCMDALFRRYASKAVDVRVRTKMVTPRRQLSATPEIQSKFTPPEVPPTKQQWVGNDEVTECMCCEATVFSMFNRRHHCRRCGRVVCGSCSPHRLKVLGYGNVKVRICSDCYDYILPRATNPEMMSSPCGKRADSKASEPEWWLTEDLVYNSTVREEFTYTHAPSVALCLSILKLHSEHSSLLRFLFTTIETMLQLLRPISPGTINPEVDYSLLVSMIRSLLEFAKLSCSQHGSGSDWAAVDGLTAEVDLMGLLVGSPLTCALLPTEPLRGHSALSTLRENLLRNELWTLALEVSTKAGLDYNSVWLAWGKACLKAGAWTDARDKFAHCHPIKKDSQMFSDIIQILQENPQITDLRSRLGRLKALSSRPDALQLDQALEPRVYEECLYYLRTYGSHASTLAFYLSQNDIQSAVSLLLESPVEMQTYLDSLFLPALRSARVTQLYSCMSEFDKTLVVFKDYLRASCAYCERNRLFNVLYQAQVWMGDHVRASMTCIHFFKHSTRTYRDLANNKTHLDTALEHLQAALQHSKEPKNSLVMSLGQEGVTRYISTVRLQLEVIAFVTATDPDSAALTVFGTAAQRTKLASLILVLGSELEQSLALAAKVAEDWPRARQAVLCSAASQLVRAGRSAVVLELAATTQQETQLCNQLIVTALKERPPQSDAEPLIALITDIPAKITAYIESEQLKSAYLLAVKHNRTADIQRILDAAIRLDQPLIKKICLKRLNLPDDSETVND